MECSNPLPQKPLSTMSHDSLCRGNIKLTQVSQHILCALKSNWQIGKFQDHWYWFQFKIINSFQEWMENVPSSGMGIFYTGFMQTTFNEWHLCVVWRQGWYLWNRKERKTFQSLGANLHWYQSGAEFPQKLHFLTLPESWRTQTIWWIYNQLNSTVNRYYMMLVKISWTARKGWNFVWNLHEYFRPQGRI